MGVEVISSSGSFKVSPLVPWEGALDAGGLWREGLGMLALASTATVLSTLRNARDVSMLAYTLRSGRVLDALEDAARRGAHVTVRLDAQPYADPRGALLRNNQAVVAALARCGADAKLVHTPGSSGAALHLKALTADSSLFLNDRNWAASGETVLSDDSSSDRRMIRDAVAGRDDPPGRSFAVRKRDALASEAQLIAQTRSGDRLDIESESFGRYNPVYTALAERARHGVHVRLLVSSRDLWHNSRERAALDALAQDGVRVRTCDAAEKFALNGSRAWVGSANATAAFDKPDQLDWGARTDSLQIIAQERANFNHRWKAATLV